MLHASLLPYFGAAIQVTGVKIEAAKVYASELGFGEGT
jgi:hypothetical protein